MIALDTSALARYLAGMEDRSTVAVHSTMQMKSAALPPVVVSELFSNPHLSAEMQRDILELPHLPILSGYWKRAGELRAKLQAQGLKAKLADCLIAQSCIDSDAPLITYDRDFRHFERAGLRVI